jgi:hypothetical protein
MAKRPLYAYPPKYGWTSGYYVSVTDDKVHKKSREGISKITVLSLLT